MTMIQVILFVRCVVWWWSIGLLTFSSIPDIIRTTIDDLCAPMSVHRRIIYCMRIAIYQRQLHHAPVTMSRKRISQQVWLHINTIHIKRRKEINFPFLSSVAAMNLKYSQLKLLNASDRYLMLGFDEISCMGDRINLPQCVVDRAKYILKILDDRKALRGQTYYAKATACLYIACRQEHTPRSYKEICAISNSSKKEIGKCFKMILNVLTATKATTTAVRTVDSCDFIERFCGHLGKYRKAQIIHFYFISIFRWFIHYDRFAKKGGTNCTEIIQRNCQIESNRWTIAGLNCGHRNLFRMSNNRKLPHRWTNMQNLWHFISYIG